MLQQAKQEREAHAAEHGQDITSREGIAAADRTLQQKLADQQTQRENRQDFLNPLAKQGIFIDQPAYESASKISAPSLAGAGMDPLQNVGQVASQLGQGANDAQGRLSTLRQKAAAALQIASGRGPGAVEPFSGGMAISQAPFPTKSVSESTSFSGVVPDQLRLRELNDYTDALNRFVTNAVAQYRAVNPYGGDPQEEARITQDAIERFGPLYDAARKKILGNNEPVTGAGGGTVRHSVGATGGAPVPQVPSPVPQQPGQIDLKAYYRNMLHRRQ
jgi:hypothetical protein